MCPLPWLKSGLISEKHGVGGLNFTNFENSYICGASEVIKCLYIRSEKTVISGERVAKSIVGKVLNRKHRNKDKP
jgi:hypothetical protein